MWHHLSAPLSSSGSENSVSGLAGENRYTSGRPPARSSAAQCLLVRALHRLHIQADRHFGWLWPRWRLNSSEARRPLTGDRPSLYILRAFSPTRWDSGPFSDTVRVKRALWLQRLRRRFTYTLYSSPSLRHCENDVHVLLHYCKPLPSLCLHTGKSAPPNGRLVYCTIQLLNFIVIYFYLTVLSTNQFYII